MTFEEYLTEVHAEGYMGTDDDMPISFDIWLTDLQVDDLMTYAQEWGDTRYKEIEEIPQFKGTMEALNNLTHKQ